MTSPRTAPFGAILALLLVASAVTPVVAAGAMQAEDVPNASDAMPVETGTDTTERRTVRSASTANLPAAAAVDGSIDLVQEFHLTPDRPGEVRVELTWRIPDNAVSLSTQVPSEVTVVDTTGFSRASGRTYEWDNRTSTATITYTVRVNETIQMGGPEGAGGKYLFVDAGEWALVRAPQVRASWSWRGPPALALNRTFTTAGPGAAGSEMVYLGEQRTYRRQAHGQTFRLVVPARADLRERPGTILDSLSRASDQLRVGDRDEQVVIFAAPTTAVSWGVRGLQYGDTDMWVRDEERLDTPDNTWIHEYVHSRQEFTTTNATRWLTEASATYYAALLTLEQDRIDLSAFRTHLAWGTESPQAGSILAQPSTWQNSANYLKGMLVAGEIDRRIRLASDKRRSLQSVISAMNTADSAVGQETFLGLVGGLSNASVRRLASVYTSTRRVPDVWSADAHRAAFGTTPARLSLRFTGSFSVSGPYRNASIARPRVYTNETLTVGVTIANTGGVATSATGTLYAGDAEVTSFTTTLGPGERTTRRVQRTFTEPGEHTLTFGADTLRVLVSTPARASVTGSSVNRTTLSNPGAVAMTATVSNNRSIPAEKTVTFRKNGDGFAKRTVRLGAGGSKTVTVVTTLSSSGEYVLRAGRDDPITVTVGDGAAGTAQADESAGGDGTGTDENGATAAPGGQGEATETAGDGGPGFGIAAALAAFAVLYLLVAPARR